MIAEQTSAMLMIMKSLTRFPEQPFYPDKPMGIKKTDLTLTAARRNTTIKVLAARKILITVPLSSNIISIKYSV
jgi:hypothetical protein